MDADVREEMDEGYGSLRRTMWWRRNGDGSQGGDVSEG
jgi:hypothetical protein